MATLKNIGISALIMLVVLGAQNCIVRKPAMTNAAISNAQFLHGANFTTCKIHKLFQIEALALLHGNHLLAVDSIILMLP